MSSQVLIITAIDQTPHFNDTLASNFTLVFKHEVPSASKLKEEILANNYHAVIVDNNLNPAVVKTLVSEFKALNDRFPFFMLSNELVFPQGINPFHVFLRAEMFRDIFPKQLGGFISSYQTTKARLLASLKELRAKPEAEFSVRDEVLLGNVDRELQEVLLGYVPLTKEEKPSPIMKSLDRMLELTTEMLNKTQNK